MFAALAASCGLSGLSLNEQLDAILDVKELKGALVSATVADLDGNLIYARNSDLRLMPASNQKLLSVAYALWKLGPEYRPKTSIWKLGDRLVVDSNGDPSMSTARLLEARQKLGITGIVPVFVRQAYEPGYGPGWEWDDLPNRYAPRISAWTVDKGSFELWADLKSVYLKENPFGISIREWPDSKMSWDYDRVNQSITFRGPKPAKPTFLEAFALLNPARSASSTLGGPHYAAFEVPRTAPTLTLDGTSIGELAKLCLVPSDNFHAENLLLMAALKDGPLVRDSYGIAAARMKDFLVKTVGADASDFDPYDGSGLSRHNNVTTGGIVKLLAWAKRQPFANLWAKSLAAAGSGTLANRLVGSSFVGKTGTLNKVVSLSGYVRLKDGREAIVSVVVNHYLGPSKGARDVADAFVRKVEDGTGSGTRLAASVAYGHDVSLKRDRAPYGDWLP